MDSDQKIFRIFEEMEREELRRAEVGEPGVCRDWDGSFSEELDFGSTKRTQSPWDEEE